MAMSEEQIQKTMKILTTWNPLGDKSVQIPDLDNYRTEAIDILAHINDHSDPSIGVRQVLNQAFNLNLSKDECKKAASEIKKIKLEKQ